MKTSNETNLFDKIIKFQEEVLEKKVSKKEILRDLSVMSFKIKSLLGDMSKLKFDDTDFLRALWSLGKLEEFTNRQMSQLMDDEAEVFFRLVEDIRIDLERRMGRASLPKIVKTTKKRARFELEIIKEVSNKVH
jgi:hypothetical protein